MSILKRIIKMLNKKFKKEKFIDHRTYCWFCGMAEMRWNCDNSFEDFGIEDQGEGVIANLSCPFCGATAEFYTKMKDDNEDTTGDCE